MSRIYHLTTLYLRFINTHNSLLYYRFKKMEGVGARLGRSSTRYGPTTVFTGPVRKWKKNWVHVSSSSSQNHHNSNGVNNNGSHLLLFKWSPISSNSNNNANGNGNSKDGGVGDKNLITKDSSQEQPPPRKKFKYVPIAVLEEQKKEDEEDAEEEATPSESDAPAGATIKSDDVDGNPDINDVPMEEAPPTTAPNKDQLVSQDLNETSLDLSLGLKGHDEDHESEAKPES